MRQWIQERQALVVAVCVVAVAAVLVWRLVGGADDGPAPEGQAWFYDVERGEAFMADAEQFAPITSPWGNEAVEVFWASCGACSEDERFPAFFRKFTDEAKQRIADDPSLGPVARGESFEGRMWSADGQSWVTAPTVAESGVGEHLKDKCPGNLRYCR